MFEVPPHVEGALAGVRPDFLVRSRRVGRRRHFVAMGALASVVALFLLGVLGLVLSGTGTVTEGGVERPASGGSMVVPALLVLAFLAVAFVVFGATFRTLRAPGPWYAGTPGGLLVVAEGQAARFHPWDDFVALRREGRDVVLSGRLEAKLLPRARRRSRPLFGPEELVIVEPEEPGRVLAAIEARLPPPPPLMHHGIRPGA